MYDRFPLNEAIRELGGENPEIQFSNVFFLRLIADAFEYYNTDPEDVARADRLLILASYLDVVLEEFYPPISVKEWKTAYSLHRGYIIGRSLETEESDTNSQTYEEAWRERFHTFFHEREFKLSGSKLDICTKNQIIRQIADRTVGEQALEPMISDEIRDRINRYERQSGDAANELSDMLTLAVYAGPVTESGDIDDWEQRAVTHIKSHTESVPIAESTLSNMLS